MSTDLTILTLDDDPHTREILSTYLEDQHFTVLQAEDGQSGLALCEQHELDLVLCDVRLPDMSGFEIVKTLTKKSPEIPVIVVSVANELSDAVKAFKLGAWDYITKPITNPAILEHAINQALERAQLLKRNRDYQDYLEQTNLKLEQSLQQLKEDEEAGRRLQFQLLPTNKQSFGCYHFQRKLWTSLYLSGDFIDYFTIDDQHIGFYMADVSGHGVSSAFVTVLLKSYMNRYLELYRLQKSQSILDPAKILGRLNYNTLKSNTNKYLTMFYGVIDRAKNELHYSNGGQFPYPLLYDGEKADYIECKSKPVGLFDFAEYSSVRLALPERFMLVLLSDGILDALAQDNLEEKRAFLTKLLEENGFNENAFVSQVGKHTPDTPPDDVTLLQITKRE